MNRDRTSRILALVALAMLVYPLAACGSRPASTSEPISKYTQTWTKSYSQTTCSEWQSKMTAPQKFAGAADMLTGARNKGDGGRGLPSDALIATFSGGLDTACVVPTSSLAETAAMLYLTERKRFRP